MGKLRSHIRCAGVVANCRGLLEPISVTAEDRYGPEAVVQVRQQSAKSGFTIDIA